MLLSVRDPVIANIAYTVLSVLSDTLKCPLIAEVLSSIVVRKDTTLFAASSVPLMYRDVAEDRVALLKRILPLPGSADVTVESYV